MKTGIMQPYFLPYIGYFQLIAAVDHFVIYDTIKYSKKGWINRNQMLVNGSASMFSVPLRNASDHLDIRDRHLAETFRPEKLCAQIEAAYRKAPEFGRVMPLLRDMLHHPALDLFDFIEHSLRLCCAHLGIATPILISSQVEGGPPCLSGAARVIDICHRVGTKVYVNPPGGRALYAAADFQKAGLDLKFLQPRLPAYTQFGVDFVASLSILDVMMFNSADAIRATMLESYDLAD